MTHIAFFEPRYSAYKPHDWELRGSYKYPSLLGNLSERAAITIFMRETPPADDPLRLNLETRHGVRFRDFNTLDSSTELGVEALVDDVSLAIRTVQPDIVSTLNGRDTGHNFAFAQAARREKIQYVYRVAGNDLATQTAVFEDEGRPFLGTALWANLVAQERYALAVARSIIVMGGTERERISGLVQEPSKIAICRRGVDQSHFFPAQKPVNQCTRFLFLGRNRAEKGIDLIEAAADIVEDFRPDIRFTIAGSFGILEKKNRRYLGFHSYADLPALYREHDALILPARSEGFPQVVMEAMSCGLPAILSHHLFEYDFKSDEGAMLLPLEPDRIAKAIIALSDDKVGYAKLSSEALAYATRHFNSAENQSFYHDTLLGEAA